MTEIHDLEPEPERPKLAPLTSGQIGLFLKARNAECACEACGQRKWAVAIDETKRLACATVGAARLDNFDEQAVEGAVVLGCGNCGNMRFFRRAPIVNWLANYRVR